MANPIPQLVPVERLTAVYLGRPFRTTAPVTDLIDANRLSIAIANHEPHGINHSEREFEIVLPPELSPISNDKNFEVRWVPPAAGYMLAIAITRNLPVRLSWDEEFFFRFRYLEVRGSNTAPQPQNLRLFDLNGAFVMNKDDLDGNSTILREVDDDGAVGLVTAMARPGGKVVIGWSMKGNPPFPIYNSVTVLGERGHNRPPFEDGLPDYPPGG